MAARVVGLDVAGVDVIAEDIGRPLEEQGGVVIEVNAGPGLQMHVDPEPARRVRSARPSWPRCSIRKRTAAFRSCRSWETANRAHHTVDLASPIEHDRQRGPSCSRADGKFVAGIRIAKGDCRDAESAAGLLAIPWSKRPCSKPRSSAFWKKDWHSTSARWPSSPHRRRPQARSGRVGGKKGPHYRSASDVVPRDGAVVLKAGEPLGSILSEKCPGETILFSADENEPLPSPIASPVERQYSRRDQDIILASEAQEFSLSQSLGAGKSQIILPAVAAAWALAIPDGQIAAALRSFR